MENSQKTVLGNRTGEHQRAFVDFLAAEAIHIGCVRLATDSIPAGCLFHRKLDTCDERVYSLNTDDYPILPLFTRTGRAVTTRINFFDNKIHLFANFVAFSLSRVSLPFSSAKFKKMLSLSAQLERNVWQILQQRYIIITSAFSS